MTTAGPIVRVALRDEPWPLHGVAASRAVEAAALASHPPHALMHAAGTAVARLAAALAPHARRFGVMCGPGNNGGDGLVAARWLHEAGRDVRVTLCADPARLAGDAAWALGEAQAAGVPIAHDPSAADATGDFGIDALLGLGSSRPLEGVLAAAAARLNGSGRQVLAVDLPSGLDADTGHAESSAVRATHTLSLLTLKPGLFTAIGRDVAGEVWLDTLGVATGADAAGAVLPGAALLHAASPRREHAMHKGSFGDVAVVGGAPGMHGAVWLAARAALAAGAGRVYSSLLDAAAPALLPSYPELMSRPRWWLAGTDTLARFTVACGCGGGDAVREALPPLLAHVPRLVLDADALNAIAADTALRTLLQRRSPRDQATIVTPHPLEAARLLGIRSADVQRDRPAAARMLAQQLGVVAVLKGSGSVVAAAHDTVLRINPSGNAALATPGSGDVLAGWIAGTWSAIAGGRDPAPAAFDAATVSVWRHGAAADRHRACGQDGPLTASALVDAMADAPRFMC